MNEVRQTAISKSWEKPKVRLARTSHHAVLANGTAFSSCGKAFEHFKIDQRRLIPVRKILKSKKNIRFIDNDTGRVYNFICVPYHQYQKSNDGMGKCRFIGRRPAVFEFDLKDAWTISNNLSLTNR